jgi:hypothetical protein
MAPLTGEAPLPTTPHKPLNIDGIVINEPRVGVYYTLMTSTRSGKRMLLVNEVPPAGCVYSEWYYEHFMYDQEDNEFSMIESPGLFMHFHGNRIFHRSEGGFILAIDKGLLCPCSKNKNLCVNCDSGIYQGLPTTYEQYKTTEELEARLAVFRTPEHVFTFTHVHTFHGVDWKDKSSPETALDTYKRNIPRIETIFVKTWSRDDEFILCVNNLTGNRLLYKNQLPPSWFKYEDFTLSYWKYEDDCFVMDEPTLIFQYVGQPLPFFMEMGKQLVVSNELVPYQPGKLYNSNEYIQCMSSIEANEVMSQNNHQITCMSYIFEMQIN